MSKEIRLFFREKKTISFLRENHRMFSLQKLNCRFLSGNKDLVRAVLYDVLVCFITGN